MFHMMGSRWKGAREAAGLSVAQAAKASGYSEAHIYKVENGDDGATLRVIQKLADVYGVTLGEIFRDESQPVRVPSELRPMLEALAPLSQHARISVVRNIASNLRFMQMLSGGAEESLQIKGSNLPSSSTTMPELNPKGDTLDVVTLPAPRDAVESGALRRDRGPEGQAGAGRARRRQHGKAAR